jgi:NADPH:quinone reductase-like Zn-dependent oxidoreductase
MRQNKAMSQGTMKTYRLPRAASIDALALFDVPIPSPGRGQTLVRVRATCLNFRDLMVAKGVYGGSRPDLLVPLSDGAGEVVAVGDGVSRVRAGDRVAGIFMQAWIGGGITPEGNGSALGGALDGMLAEYVVLDAAGLVHIPPHLSFEEAATLPCAAVTAWHAVVEHGRTKAGDTVLVQGTGGVSIFALQFARMLGARVIATSSSDAKLERARALGADTGINYRTMPDWQDAAREATGGRGVDLVVEVGGAGTFGRSMQAVRIGGRISLIGVLTGAAEVNPTGLMRASINVQGIYVGSREMFEAMNRAIAQHEMRPVIDRVFDFGDAKAAYRHLEGATHLGKVVIRV